MRSLRTQLLLSHLALVVLMGLVMGGAILAFFELGHSIDQVLQNNFETVLSAGQFRTAIGDESTALDMLMTDERPKAQANFDAARARAEADLDVLRQSVTEEQEVAMMNQLDQDYASFLNDAENLMFANRASMSIGAPQLLRTKFRTETAHISDIASQLQSLNEHEILEANLEAQNRAREYFLRSMAVTVVALVLAAVLAMRMVRLALTPLAALAKQAESIAQGDLDQRVTFRRKDEIGALAESFNEMAAKLAEVRKTDVRRLKKAEMMSDAAIESMYDPVVVTDATSRIVHLNRAAEQLFGPIPAGERVPLINHIQDKRISKAIKRSIHEEAPATRDEDAITIEIGEGEAQRTYRLRATPMKDDAAALLGSVTVLEDITHLKQLDRLKTEFIGVASHELRTPVTSLMLSSELLLEGAVGPITDDQRDVLAIQKEDLMRLEKLMRDLLDVTKLESGSIPHRRERLSPKEIAEGPMHTLAGNAVEKDIKLTAEFPEDLPEIYVDRIQMGRVLTNLAANAIRHTERGGSVKIMANSSAEGVTFTVEDTGQGIPKEYLARIFERFVQVPGATQGGAGLGLSIANNIVKAHGGTMSVESELGMGSKFMFTVPAADAVEGKENQA